MDAPRLLTRDAAGYHAAWRDVVVEEWTAPGTAEHMRARHGQTMAYLRALEGRKIVTVSVVHEAAAKPPSSELKDAIDEATKERTPHTKASAVVLLVPGFKAAVIRSIIAGVTMLTNAKMPTKTDGDVEAALRWAAQHLDGHGGRTPSADDLVAAYRAMQQLAR